MNTKTITLTLDKAKEWYKKGGELREVALQAYTEEELTKFELPKTWEEFFENHSTKSGECFISNTSEIIPITGHYRIPSRDKNIVPSKEAAEAHLALMQLHQLRDCYRKDWVPNWDDATLKYYIMHYGPWYCIGQSRYDVKFLSFQSKDIVEKFLANFKDLIKKAGDLI